MDAREVARLLLEPFHPDEVKWKPQVVKDARACVIAYVDARAVMDRLDDAFGVAGWRDEYEVLADGAATCRLSVRMGDEWITKMDVGGESGQPDEGDRRKASFSDALKRAAVKFGIGRYLYRLPQQWVDYDPQKKRIVRVPTLPTWAVPGGKKHTPAPALTEDGEVAPEVLTSVELYRLKELVQSTGADEAALCAYLKVVSLSVLPRFRYQEALDALERKRKLQIARGAAVNGGAK